MAFYDDNRNNLSTDACNFNGPTSNSEPMIDVSGLKEEVNPNSRAIDELEKQCLWNQVLTDLQDIKNSIATLQSITDSLLSVMIRLLSLDHSIGVKTMPP